MIKTPDSRSINTFFGSCKSCDLKARCAENGRSAEYFTINGCCPPEMLDSFHNGRTFIALRGKLHSGKSTIASIIKDVIENDDNYIVKILPLAEPLYIAQNSFGSPLGECPNCHKLSLGFVETCGYCGSENGLNTLVKHRRFLQEMGELVRTWFGDKVLGYRLLARINEVESEMKNKEVVTICDDPRTKYDFDMLCALNAIVISVQTPDELRHERGNKNGTASDIAEQHRLETELDNYGGSDFVIIDRNDEEDIKMQVKCILDQIIS